MAAFHLVLPAALLLSSCAPVALSNNRILPLDAAPPTGARLSSAGYVTITDAPPSPFPDAPPPEPVRRASPPDPAQSPATARGGALGQQRNLESRIPQPAAFADPRIETYVRAFARESRVNGIQLLAGSSGRIVLQDGCFRLAAGADGERGALVMFGYDTQLALDDEGYLIVLGEGGARRYRVGEMASWGGPNAVDENDPNTQALRRRCGDGPISNVAVPESQRLFGTPYAHWLADYARARGLAYHAAWREVTDCILRQEREGHTGIDARDRCIRQFN